MISQEQANIVCARFMEKLAVRWKVVASNEMTIPFFEEKRFQFIISTGNVPVEFIDDNDILSADNGLLVRLSKEFSWASAVCVRDIFEIAVFKDFDSKGWFYSVSLRLIFGWERLLESK